MVTPWILPESVSRGMRFQYRLEWWLESSGMKSEAVTVRTSYDVELGTKFAWSGTTTVVCYCNNSLAPPEDLPSSLRGPSQLRFYITWKSQLEEHVRAVVIQLPRL